MTRGGVNKMKKMYFKMLSVLASAAFVTAITAVNLISTRGMYEESEPESLKKYSKF